MMERKEFLLLLDELMEFDPGTLRGPELLADIDMWDSLAVISFIAMVDEKLGVVVDSDRLTKAKTVNDLLDLSENKVAV